MRASTGKLILVILVLSSYTDIVSSQGLLGQSLEERRAEERREQQREESDKASEYSETWQQNRQSKRARLRAELLAEQRAERLNEISYLYAQLIEPLPEGTKLINRPYPSEYQLNGRIKRATKPSSPKEAVATTIADIQSQDLLCLSFWAKAVESKKNTEQALITKLGVRSVANPNQILFENSEAVSTQWQHFAYSFKSLDAFKEGEAEVFFNVGERKQTLELGPAYLFNLGQADLSQASGKACSAD